MQLSITIKNAGEVGSKLGLLGKSLSDFSIELKSTGEFLKEYYGSFPFVSEGQVYGERWAPLSPAYAIEKAKKYRGKGILIASGKMQSAFQFTSTSNFLRVYNATEYFKYHQLGTNKMPKRQVMGLNAELGKGIAEIFKKAIDIKIKGL